MGADTMAEERKIHTPYDYCISAVEMLCDIEDDHENIPEDLAVKLLQAAQLMRIADDLGKISKKVDEIEESLRVLSADGIKAYIYND
jgi:hypothetical protein